MKHHLEEHHFKLREEYIVMLSKLDDNIDKFILISKIYCNNWYTFIFKYINNIIICDINDIDQSFQIKIYEYCITTDNIYTEINRTNIVICDSFYYNKNIIIKTKI